VQDIQQYLALRERPEGRPVMLQNWRDLAFLHLRYEPEVIQGLLPPSLTVDTYPDESGKEWAWLAIVPFWMRDIRLSRLPVVPGTHTFCETNVRTYVHHNGERPGVWFFSLDAANAFACHVARRFFRLPYYFAEMQTSRSGEHVTYESQRKWLTTGSSSSNEGQVTLQVEINGPIQTATPGTLEFFLAERYLLYSESPLSLTGKPRTGSAPSQLFSGLVHHPPYPLQAATASGNHSMLTPLGLENRDDWDHVIYSPGVDVEVFPLRPVN
jgi:uncharacterized protein